MRCDSGLLPLFTMLVKKVKDQERRANEPRTFETHGIFGLGTRHNTPSDAFVGRVRGA
jgi:hypothetical protein